MADAAIQSPASALDASQIDASEDAAVSDTSMLLARCAGGTYAAAPSGAVCDARRIERAGDFEGPCYGPPVGSTCDRLQMSLPSDDATTLPVGFVCSPPSLGRKTCVWSVGGDAAPNAFDDAALEAACAVTATLSTVTVLCQTHGS